MPATERVDLNDRAEPVGEAGGAVGVGLGQHDDELLAAVAGDRVDLADLGAHPAGQLDQHRVADLVAVLVVDGLEPVEVEHQRGERPAEPGRALDLVAEADREVAVVPQAGQRVGQRQPLRLLVQQHVVDRDARLAGERQSRCRGRAR